MPKHQSQKQDRECLLLVARICSGGTWAALENAETYGSTKLVELINSVTKEAWKEEAEPKDKKE